MLLAPSCLCCLPGRLLLPCLLASACSPLCTFVVGLRLPALLSGVLAGSVMSVRRGLLCVFVWFGLFGASLWCSLLFLLLLASPHVPLDKCASLSCFTCTTKALIYPSTYVSDRRLGRFTCTFDFHRFTMFFLLLLCDFPQCTKVTKGGWQLLTLTNHTHPPL